MKFHMKASIFESLEVRNLLSSSFASVNSNGTLSVVGTGKADTITVQASGSKVQAIVNGATESFTSSTVKRIWIEAFGGNDKITNKTSLKSTLIGDAGNDTIVGGNASDTIQDSGGNDQFDGGAGNDSIDSANGSDTIIASAGNDWANLDDATVDYSAQKQIDLTFYGWDVYSGDLESALGDISLNQNDPHLHIIGTPGNDTFKGEAPDGTVVHGEAGNDTFNIGAAQGYVLPTVYGDDGDDICTDNYDSPASFYGGAGNDVINDDSGYTNITIDGGSGFDTDNLNPDTPIAEAPTAEFTVPTGIEKFSVEVEFGLTVHGNNLDNIINAIGANVTVYGNDGNDQITATAEGPGPFDTPAGHVLIDGGSGNDLLHGIATLDSTLKGGSGNDTLVGDAGAAEAYPNLPANPSYTYEGDGGNDTADFSDRTANLTLHIDGQADSGISGEKDLISGDIENIIGGSGDDLITGNPSNNSLEGGAGNDTIWGSSGNDTLVGDAGHDQLHGQDGNDTLLGKDGQVDTLDGGDGTDTAQRDNSASVKDVVLSIEKFI